MGDYLPICKDKTQIEVAFKNEGRQLQLFVPAACGAWLLPDLDNPGFLPDLPVRPGRSASRKVQNDHSHNVRISTSGFEPCDPEKGRTFPTQPAAIQVRAPSDSCRLSARPVLLLGLPLAMADGCQLPHRCSLSLRAIPDIISVTLLP